MEHDRVDVRIEGSNQEHVLAVEETLGDDVIAQMARAARRYDVMITITVSPYVGDDTEESQRAPLDR